MTTLKYKNGNTWEKLSLGLDVDALYPVGSLVLQAFAGLSEYDKIQVPWRASFSDPISYMTLYGVKPISPSSLIGGTWTIFNTQQYESTSQQQWPTYTGFFPWFPAQWNRSDGTNGYFYPYAGYSTSPSIYFAATSGQNSPSNAYQTGFEFSMNPYRLNSSFTAHSMPPTPHLIGWIRVA